MMGGYGYGSGGYGYGPMMGGYGWVGIIVGLIMFLLIVVGVILLIVWMVRTFGAGAGMGGAGAVGHDRAVAIAKERLAKGEITKEEYQEMLKHLGSG